MYDVQNKCSHVLDATDPNLTAAIPWKLLHCKLNKLKHGYFSKYVKI